MRTVSADWVVPVEGDPIADGAVVIGDDGLIEAVGRSSELGAGERFEDAVIVPGFVNAHTHLEYAMYAGFGDGLSFAPWIMIHIERKARLAVEDMEAIARVGAADCLRSGVTTIGDASYAGAAATACDELGLRAIVFLEVFGTTAEQLDTRFAENRARIEPALTDRVQVGISPHAPYTCSPELYAACLELGLPVTTHLSESPDEALWMETGTGGWEPLAAVLPPPPGRSGIRELAGHCLLRPGLLAAHCVTVDEAEIAILAENGVAVAHCPRSNGILGCGTAPVAALRDAGVPVCIATDSPASTPSFDMFEELRAAILAARARERRPDALSVHDALAMATIEGARALGLGDRTGSLVPGKQADLAVITLRESPFIPLEDPVTAVVLGGSPERVTATLVAGEDRYRKGTTDWRDLRSRAARARSRMLL